MSLQERYREFIEWSRRVSKAGGTDDQTEFVSLSRVEATMANPPPPCGERKTPWDHPCFWESNLRSPISLEIQRDLTRKAVNAFCYKVVGYVGTITPAREVRPLSKMMERLIWTARQRRKFSPSARG